jgi:hypothetical protein
MTAIEGDPAVLSCWKDIAQYLGKAVRTVQRWEQELGLPVRRPKGVHHKSAVIAYVRDLDSWMESQWSERGTPKESDRNRLNKLSELIQISQALRVAHQTLMEETSLALVDLVANCNQLNLTWHINDEPLPSWPMRDEAVNSGGGLQIAGN